MWQKDYKIYDHLGSLRLVLRADPVNTYNVITSTDYEPFGRVLSQSGKSTRETFIGKENDIESELGDFGVRKFSDETGRFTSIDPLFEKYYNWSPYVYSMNNPVNVKDDNGKIVEAVTDVAQNAVRGTVPENLQQFVQFNNGVLDNQMMKRNMPSGIDVNSNFATLSRIADNPMVVNVDVNQKVAANDSKGNDNSKEFYQNGKSTYNGNEIWGDGLTILPKGMEKQGAGSDGLFSKDNKINVFLNPKGGRSLSEEAKHELFLHVRIALQKKWAPHIWDEKGNDQNKLIQYYQKKIE
jgi:RHS repeat-associated protein